MRTLPIASFLLLAAPLAPLAAAESAQDYWVRVMPAVWLPQLDGDVAYRGSSASTSSTLTMSELGLDDRQSEFQVEAGAKFPFLFAVDAGYSGFATEGDAVLQRNVAFGNQVFLASTRVETDVALRDFWGELSIRPLDLDIAGIGIGIAAHAIDADIEVRDATSGTAESIDETIYVPAGALRAHVTPLPGFTVEARVHYMELGYDGQRLRFFDGAVQASYRPVRWVGVLAGYRHQLIDAHVNAPEGGNSQADVDVSLSGPYVGLIAAF